MKAPLSVFCIIDITTQQYIPGLLRFAKQRKFWARIESA